MEDMGRSGRGSEARSMSTNRSVFVGWDRALLVEHLACMRPGVRAPALHQPALEAGGSVSHSYPEVHNESEASPGYIRTYLKK